MHKQLEMAQRAPTRTGRSRRESIADLAKDLELLRVDSKDYGETKESMAKARDLRIKELKKSNGTLLEVCFSYVHKTFASYHCTFKIRFSPAWIIRTLDQLFP